MIWKEGKRAPRKMNRYCDAVVDGNTVYVKNKFAMEIYSYNVTSDSWSQLPDCIQMGGSITIVNGWLTTVGGRFRSSFSNELFSLTREGNDKRWSKTFPPMPTKREHTTALRTGTMLIVAGGWGEDGVLSTVEVMNTENQQWSTAADLPQPQYSASATVYGNQLCLLGGLDKDRNSTKLVYSCSVSSLLQSCVQSLDRTASADKASVWRRVTDLPVTHSTCESFHCQLLAIGGWDSAKAITAVYTYNSTTNSWEIISHMTTARYCCFTAVLPDDRIMVVGGINMFSIDTVEFASTSN